MDPLMLIVVAGALAIGLVVGWLIAGRGAAAAREAAGAAEARAQAAETAAAVAEERAREAPPLRLMVDGLREERDEARRLLAAAEPVAARVAGLETSLGEARARAESLAAEIAAFRRGEAERAQAHEAQVATLKEMETRLAGSFDALAGKALGEAQRTFLDRADARFRQSEESGAEKLKALLQPVETTLRRYEEGLTRVEKDRVGSYGELREAVAQLAKDNALVRSETARLTNVMRSSPKARGRWGEEQLRTILESAGLAENVDFSLQTSISDGERQLRPDCVITLPGGRTIVVDVKCPLVHFEQAFDEEDEGRRAALLLQHSGAMKAYAADLGRKGYWRQFDLSPDFVIMFIPGEHFLSAAAERAPDLIETAYRSGVIVASTINMLALAKVMAGMWRQEQLAAEARQVGEVGKELYKRLATMGGHVSRLGRNLGLAADAYNSFVGSLESQVLTQARRLEELKIETGGKSIDTPPVVESAIRPLTKLEALADAAE